MWRRLRRRLRDLGKPGPASWTPSFQRLLSATREGGARSAATPQSTRRATTTITLSDGRTADLGGNPGMEPRSVSLATTGPRRIPFSSRIGYALIALKTRIGL